jgi:hypothetical protein
MMTGLAQRAFPQAIDFRISFGVNFSLARVG